MWPFEKKQEIFSLPRVELTEDELEECKAHKRALYSPPVDDNGNPIEGNWAIKAELQDSLDRFVVADCLMGRAERFMILRTQPDSGLKACEAAAKACAVFPVSIYFYDFGCILRSLEKKDEAKQMFKEFLRRSGQDFDDSFAQALIRQRDVEFAIEDAREFLR